MSSHRRRRVSLPVAIALIALVSIAAPAAAALVINNFITGSITATPACLTKIAGADAPGGTANANVPTVNTTNTFTTPASSPKLLNELVTIPAFLGDRTIWTDIVRYSNTCSYSLNVSLIAQVNPSGTPVVSTPWPDLGLKIYLSKLSAPGTVLTLGTDWDQAPITVSAAGALGNTTTGAVALASGSTLTTGFQIDAGLSATAYPATFNYTVQGTK